MAVVNWSRSTMNNPIVRSVMTRHGSAVLISSINNHSSRPFVSRWESAYRRAFAFTSERLEHNHHQQQYQQQQVGQLKMLGQQMPRGCPSLAQPLAIKLRTISTSPFTSSSSTTNDNRSSQESDAAETSKITAAREQQISSLTTSTRSNTTTTADSEANTATPTPNQGGRRQQQQQQRRRRRQRILPLKSAVQLTDRARQLFQRLLHNPPRPDICGILLQYRQSPSGEPRMVFYWEFVTPEQITEKDEPVSLEMMEDGVTVKSPRESWNDGLPKLYIHHDALLKVLGATVDVDLDDANAPTFLQPILHDRDGNLMDPNA